MERGSQLSDLLRKAGREGSAVSAEKRGTAMHSTAVGDSVPVVLPQAMDPQRATYREARPC
jgi:hypothetical protein